MTAKFNILIMFKAGFSEQQLNKLQEIAPQAEITNVSEDEVTDDIITKADIIFGWPSEEQLDQAENLTWLQLPSAGADKYIDQDLYQNEVKLTNATGVYGMPVAEQTLGMILAFNHNFPQYIKQQQENKWEAVSAKKDIYGSTFGILGFGDLGKEIARRANALGAEVLALKKTIKESPDYVTELYTPDQLNQVLKNSDYLVLTLPLTEETEGIISSNELKCMNDDALLVNVGRGELVVQEDLIEALANNSIGGAALDVTTPEPLPEENPLWELDNVLITPHCGGYSPTNPARLYELFSNNLQRYVKKKPLKNKVNFKTGY
jgi:phosphoglycerate dehydrogenase-like enzyme